MFFLFVGNVCACFHDIFISFRAIWHSFCVVLCVIGVRVFSVCWKCVCVFFQFVGNVCACFQFVGNVCACFFSLLEMCVRVFSSLGIGVRVFSVCWKCVCVSGSYIHLLADESIRDRICRLRL